MAGCAASCDCPYQDAAFLSNICVEGYGSGSGHAPVISGTSTATALTLFLGVVEMVLRSKCDIAEPCRRARPDSVLRRVRFEYDFIVVGAGVAGSVVRSHAGSSCFRSRISSTRKFLYIEALQFFYTEVFNIEALLEGSSARKFS